MPEDQRGRTRRLRLLALSFFAFFSFILNTTFSFSAEEPEPQARQQAPSQSRPGDKPQRASREGPPGAESPVTFLARSWERTENRIFATGDVEVHYKNLKVFADQVEINTETKDILAKGNVVIQLPTEVVRCESLFYNLDSHKGKMENANGMMQPTVFYQAVEIEQKTQDTYGLTKARLTSCTQPTPRWNFSCAKATLKKNDYVAMWSSVFTIKKVPIFYMPYLRYPLNEERSTGFLMPQLGYSGAKGFFYGQAFFWAMARNMDATFGLDYYSAKGVGGGLEYRYLFGDGTGGEARVYYFYFKPGAEGNTYSNAYLVRFRHNQPLPADFRLVANIDYQTSIDFMRDFDNNFKRASISNFKSEAYISRAWSNYNFTLRASRFETYYTSVDNSILTYYLPQLTLNSFKIKLFSPVYFSFSSALTSWKYGWRYEYDAGKEKYYNSVSFSPALSLPFSRIPWLTLNTTLSSNFAYYAQSYAPNTRLIVNDPVFIPNYRAGVEWTGPVFYRIYQSAGGETKIKHIIEPTISYRYDSPVNEPDRIITPYGYFRYHQLVYGLTNRVLVKRDMPREIFTWGINQTYYLSPEDSPLSIYRYKGTVPKYSDISSYLRFYPGKTFSLDCSSAYNTYFKTFSHFRLGASLNSPSDPFFLSVSWFKSLNPWYTYAVFNRQQIGTFGRVKIPQLNLDVFVDIDYNVLQRKILYSALGLVYHYQCLSIKADLRQFYYRTPAETQFRISVELGNIGKTTDFMGGFGF